MLESLGNIGDFVGGIAVVVTLVYLATQIRENTRATRASTVHDLWQHSMEFSRLAAADPQVARVWRLGQAGRDGLDEDETAQFTALCMNLLRGGESAFMQLSDDDPGLDVWRKPLRRMLQSPGLTAVWAENRMVFHDDYASWIESLADLPPAA